MKTIARFIFKLHRVIFKYPCRSEVRLALQYTGFSSGLTWYAAMLYICDEKISDIADWLDMPESQVKQELNKSLKDFKF
jgi:hypothetical protein